MASKKGKKDKKEERPWWLKVVMGTHIVPTLTEMIVVHASARALLWSIEIKERVFNHNFKALQKRFEKYERNVRKP